MHKTLCFTGHRRMPGKGYDDDWQQVKTVVSELILLAYDQGFRTFYCGGAIGFDTVAAKAILAARLTMPGIKLAMAIPFKGQPNKWPAATQQEYYAILKQADIVAYIDEVLLTDNIGEYSPRKMFVRNEYMVDQSDAVIAYISSINGGTVACTDYAMKQGVPVLTINPGSLTRSWNIPK